MATTVNNATSATSAVGATNASKNTPTDAAASQDRFLKLLVAQLNNQDPMNPMDNAQMTSQMAQINTVSGIQQLNDTMKSMATQFAAMQTLQGASMVGRDVLTDGNRISIKDGVGKGSLDLAGPADQVKIEITTSGGQALGTVNLGSQAAGRQNFEWDASSYAGTERPVFKVIATQGGKPVTATPLSRGTVESVSTVDGAMSVAIKGGGSVAYDAIKAIL
jgi:flagellar basal-body rod modification protein FlgD